MGVVTLDEARLALGVTDDDQSVDDALQGYVDGITKVIERHLNQTIDATEVTEQRWFPSGSTRFVLRQSPVISLDSLVTVDGLTTWDVDDYVLDAATGIVDWGRVTGSTLYGHVAVTYTAGYDTVPQFLKQGALTTLQHLWETQRGVGTAGSGVVGSEESFDPDVLFPRKALEWLGPAVPGIA